MLTTDGASLTPLCASPHCFVDTALRTEINNLSVSLELLTVLGAGPMACYIIRQIARNDPARHYWIIILCTGEIYGT